MKLSILILSILIFSVAWGRRWKKRKQERTKRATTTFCDQLNIYEEPGDIAVFSQESSCYEFYYNATKYATNYSKAREICFKGDGHLAILTKDGMLNTLDDSNLGIYQTMQKNDYWFGLHRSDNGWVWDGGSELTLTNAISADLELEDTDTEIHNCMSTATSFKMKETNCSVQLPFICEYHSDNACSNLKIHGIRENMEIFAYEDSCFQFYEGDNKNFDDARTMCDVYPGGHLAFVTDSSIMGALQTKWGDTLTDTWIGLKQRAGIKNASAEWYWTDDDQFFKAQEAKQIIWKDNFPDDNNIDKECGMIKKTFEGIEDKKCSDSNKFLCEYNFIELPCLKMTPPTWFNVTYNNDSDDEGNHPPRTTATILCYNNDSFVDTTTCVDGSWGIDFSVIDYCYPAPCDKILLNDSWVAEYTTQDLSRSLEQNLAQYPNATQATLYCPFTLEQPLEAKCYNGFWTSDIVLASCIPGLNFMNFVSSRLLRMI